MVLGFLVGIGAGFFLGSRYDYDKVKKVEAPDPWTVRVTYKEPYVPALESWGFGWIAFDPTRFTETGGGGASCFRK